jgi:membrane-bound lytic murein transglycosylase D
MADEPYFVTLPLDSDIDLRVAARLAGLPYEDLIALNPGYNKPHAPGALRASLVVPVESADAARESFEKYFEERTAERARQKGSRRR